MIWSDWELVRRIKYEMEEFRHLPDEYSGSFVALESDNAQVSDTQVNLITIWILENKPIKNARLLSKTLTKKIQNSLK